MIWWLAGLAAIPSAMWLFGLLLWRSKSASGQNSNPNDPIVAVVVARNEAVTIEACLTALLGQKPRLARVILADDGSTDGTNTVAMDIASADRRLEVIKMLQFARPESPKKEALATAFGQIGEQLVCCTDADCVVPSSWAGCLKDDLDDQTGAILGASFPPTPTTLAERLYRWERLIANSSMASACGWGYPASACGHSILYRTKALREVQAPVRRDLPSGDDDLTVQAIARKGWKIHFCSDPQSVVTDLGGGKVKRWSQAGRHQSVTYLYPLRWRFLYAATIVANIAPLAALPFVPWLGWLPMLACWLPRVALDGLSAMLLKSRLHLDISVFEVFAAALLLPIWSLWRALASIFASRIEWRGREFSPASN